MQSKHEYEHSVLVGFNGDENDFLNDRTEQVILRNKSLLKSDLLELLLALA